MGWGMAQAEYGSKEHLDLMRNDWEPVNVVTVPQSNQITREVVISFFVFLKKRVENADKGTSSQNSAGIIQG
jgi:hypothetical protein